MLIKSLMRFIRNKFQSELQFRELQNPSDIVKKWSIIFTLVVLIEPSNDLKETFKMFWNIRHKSIDMDRCGWIISLDNYIPRKNSAFPTTDYYYLRHLRSGIEILDIYRLGSKYLLYADWGRYIGHLPTIEDAQGVSHPLSHNPPLPVAPCLG